MLSKLTITNGKWIKISAAGKSGTAWLKSFDGLNPVIVISHSTSAISLDGNNEVVYASASPLDKDIAYRLPTDRISDKLTADSVLDIFYATIKNPGKTCEIIVDFN